MDSKIESKKLHKSLVFAKAEHCSKVMRVVFMKIDSGEFAITKYIAINPTRDSGKFGDAENKSENGKPRAVWATNRSIASSKVGPQ